MGGSLKSLVRLPGRIVKEGSQWAAPCAISLPPSCLQCDCEGRSSWEAALWPRGQGPQPTVGAHSWRKAGLLTTWRHVYPVHTGHRLTLHETERESSLGLSRISNKTQSDVRRPFFLSPRGLPCHVRCKTTVFGTNFLDLSFITLLFWDSGPQPLVMDLYPAAAQESHYVPLAETKVKHSSPTPTPVDPGHCSTWNSLVILTLPLPPPIAVIGCLLWTLTPTISAPSPSRLLLSQPRRSTEWPLPLRHLMPLKTALISSVAWCSLYFRCSSFSSGTEYSWDDSGILLPEDVFRCQNHSPTFKLISWPAFIRYQ